MSETGQLEVITSSSALSTFTWKIENFSKKDGKCGEFITSPVFEFGDCNKKTYSKCVLKLYPFGYNSETKDFISVYLDFLSIPSSMLKEYLCSYEIFIHDGTQNDTSIKKLSEIEKFTSYHSMWGWRRFVRRSNLIEKENTFLKEDTLIILLSIFYASFKVLNHFTHMLTDKYESIYLSGDFSDATIVIDNKKINVHKAILSARSKVFSVMFKNDMAEANYNLITISDVEYTVMDKFLLYIYSGKVDDIDKCAISLLPVADKYDVGDLKSLCEDTLLNSLIIDNACEILSIADIYNCRKLRTKTIDFIALHAKKIIKTQGFEDLSSSTNQTLFKEIFYKVVEKIVNKITW